MTTLYVTEPYSVVKKDGETLVVHIPADKSSGRQARKVEVPAAKVTEVVLLGDSTLTPQAMAALSQQGVPIVFLDPYGNLRARVVPAESKNSLLRLAQFRAHENPTLRFELARACVVGKLHNQRTLLLRSNRRLNDRAINAAVEALRIAQAQVEALQPDTAPPPDPTQPQKDTAWGQLQGLEGAGAAAYFDAFGRILREDSGLTFQTRTRRPPRDPVNALLSFAYALLLRQCLTALQIVGLDPYIGFLHGAHYGKPALALDLMEEFRTPIAESVVVTLVNNRVLQPDDFIEEFGAYRLKDSARRTFLQKFEERMNTTIQHPVFGYTATYRRCVELQARLLAKTLQGELPSYRAFKVR